VMSAKFRSYSSGAIFGANCRRAMFVLIRRSKMHNPAGGLAPTGLPEMRYAEF